MKLRGLHYFSLGLALASAGCASSLSLTNMMNQYKSTIVAPYVHAESPELLPHISFRKVTIETLLAAEKGKYNYTPVEIRGVITDMSMSIIVNQGVLGVHFTIEDKNKSLRCLTENGLLHYATGLMTENTLRFAELYMKNQRRVAVRGVYLEKGFVACGYVCVEDTCFDFVAPGEQLIVIIPLSPSMPHHRVPPDGTSS